MPDDKPFRKALMQVFERDVIFSADFYPEKLGFEYYPLNNTFSFTLSIVEEGDRKRMSLTLPREEMKDMAKAILEMIEAESKSQEVQFK